MGVDGILNVDKPEGKTSFHVVARLKRLTGEKHVGHAGTLDPIATGVLPVCLGQATRVAQFISNGSKTYSAQIELGTTTDTYDREGKIVQCGDWAGVTRQQVEEALSSFQGVINQVPPAFSALKQGGRRYYSIARAGSMPELKPRRVEITRLELLDCRFPVIEVEIDCGKGTYVRSLAHDIGQQLGCGAHLKNLRRLQCGIFSVQNALTLEQIEDALNKGALDTILYPVDSPLSHLKAVIVSRENELDIRHGCPLPVADNEPISGEYCRAYDAEGKFLAILHFVAEKRLWHPQKVFSI